MTCLAEGELDVAGARREVDDQVVQLTPLCRRQQLVDHACGMCTRVVAGLVRQPPTSHTLNQLRFCCCTTRCRAAQHSTCLHEVSLTMIRLEQMQQHYCN